MGSPLPDWNRPLPGGLRPHWTEEVGTVIISWANPKSLPISLLPTRSRSIPRYVARSPHPGPCWHAVAVNCVLIYLGLNCVSPCWLWLVLTQTSACPVVCRNRKMVPKGFFCLSSLALPLFSPKTSLFLFCSLSLYTLKPLSFFYLHTLWRHVNIFFL